MKKRPIESDDPFERWEARVSAWLDDPRLTKVLTWASPLRLTRLLHLCLALTGLIVLALTGRIGAAVIPLLAVLIGIGAGVARGVRPVLYFNLIVTALAAVTLPFLLTLGGMYTDREQVGSFDAGIGGLTVLLLLGVLTANGLASAALLWVTRYHHDH